MKRLIALFLFAATSPAMAKDYTVVLSPPDGGEVLRGHAGLHAVDARSDTTLVRVISPGSDVRERGTIRVLVMNLGTATFPFGPNQVSLELGDGTKLAPVPISQFIKGADLIEREMKFAGATDLQNRNNLSGLAQQSGGGATAQSAVPLSRGPAGPSSVGIESFDNRTDAMLLPGAKTLDSIYQVLEEQPVEPKRAWGGYYVFNLPKPVRALKADQPLTIVVTTGAEVRRFQATLRYN